MRLDATDLRYISSEEFRVLSAVETGSRNHEVVPTPLIAELSSIRSGIVTKCLYSLAKRNLVARVQGAKYDGYRLTYGGLDYLALRVFSKRNPASVSGVGNKIGVGKESDIYVVKDEGGKERVLKIHRLGRISFRRIKEKRDYLGKRKSSSWMYMSRLAAQKEYAFMQILHKYQFPVPLPIDQAKHCIVMSLIDSYPLRQIDDIPDPSSLYSTLMTLLLRLAHCGLIHGDFNEFNILIHRKTGEATLIDFPQMVSTNHPNAEFFFQRDVECIKRFFYRRFRYQPSTWPRWRDVLAGPQATEEDGAEGSGEASSSSMASKIVRLDVEVEASGWKKDDQTQLEEYMTEVGALPHDEDEEEDNEDFDDEDDDDQEDEEEDGDAEEVEQSHAANEPELDVEARLEKIRLNRALGNDDEEDVGIRQESDIETPPESDPEDSESDDESEDNVTSHQDTAGRGSERGPPGKHQQRLKPKQLNRRDKVADRVGQELGGGKGGSKANGGGKDGGRVKAGKAKGHKWKSSDTYLVGKNSGW